MSLPTILRPSSLLLGSCVLTGLAVTTILFLLANFVLALGGLVSVVFLS